MEVKQGGSVGFLVPQVVENLVMQEAQVCSLSRKILLREDGLPVPGMLVRIPVDRGACGQQSTMQRARREHNHMPSTFSLSESKDEGKGR